MSNLNKRSPIFSACRAFFAFFLIFGFYGAAHAALSDEWTWKIFVIPPDSGWSSEEGRSIRATLTWFERETNEDPNGILDHDVSFVCMETPVTEKTAEAAASAVRNSNCIAALNFASDEMNRLLVPLLKDGRIPVLLSRGEDVWLTEGDVPYPYVFALQLYRDYRTAALTEYAKKVFAASADNRIAIVASRFSLNEEREATICEDILYGMNMPAISFWTDSSTFNTFRLLEDEVKSESAGILFCYVGSMATREIWRGVRGLESRYQIWYPGVPNELFTSYNGIVFADQSLKDIEEGVFVSLKRKLWSTRAVDVKDEAAAGNAYALVSWLFEAIKKGGSADAGILAQTLATAENIPFGSRTLNISAKTHRPEFRSVYIMRIVNKTYESIDILKIKGL